MTTYLALVSLIGFHAVCWLCLILVRLDVRKRREREAEHLDAVHNRTGGGFR